MSIGSSVGSFIDKISDFVTDALDYVTGNPDAVAFIVLAAVTIAAAIFVVISDEVVHSAFYLALTFVCVAATYFFLEAEFIGVVQLMVYVGAITIMFAFSIMLTRRTIMKRRDDDE
ncbi:MAG: NADH-quinone oxidoreductase subunit J [Methanomassiliicoccaceae archaeon]|nr:NADH-quinone oxidoreductase subunit J [Methanomassiliicoccaceae archaeon]